MTHAQTKQTDISIEVPTLSKQAKTQNGEKERQYTAPPVKQTSFTFIMLSSLVTSLSVLAVTVATAKMWRPKLFPELKKIESLEKDMIALHQEMLSLNGDTKNKELLNNEVASLKQEIDKAKTDIKVKMAEVNNKINTVTSEQKNNSTPQEEKTLEEDSIEEDSPKISMDAGVFHVQFLTAIEENKPLSKYYEQAGKLDISDEFQHIINDIKKINFEKIQSDEELSDSFKQMHSDILQDTMITKNAQTSQKNLVDSIAENIQITHNNQPNRAQLKSDFIMAKRLLDRDDLEGTIDILTPYAHHKNVRIWIKHAQERIDHDDAIQNVRNFKGPYSK
ncbi:MAG: hypothetical protein COY39_05080 [Alphaproteobacteria bacterium CG_4_10_14_0_8_um_filter_37_21]|nr:MAG: hypothetical protein COY39_05080 [Alphaproteobacteria bacterium CG_4_10_14_0_8_um_filter_37_21]